MNAAATVDEDSLATAAFDDFDFGLASGQTGTVTARYNVTAIRGISAFCPATQSTVRIRFRDSDGAGTAEQVLVTIHQTNVLAGGNTTIFTFDSNAAGFPADAAFHTAVLTPAIDFDFARNIYWIEVQVSRSDSAAFANASKMDIWESVGTPCP